MEKIWRQSYPTDVPETIEVDEFSSLVDLLEKKCKQYAHKPAFMNHGCTLTYEQLDQYSLVFAHYLLEELKLAPGSRVALMLPNLLQYPVAFFGILRAGMIVVNCNPLYSTHELTHQLNDAEVKAIVVLTDLNDHLLEALPDTQLQHIIATEAGDLFPTWKRCLATLLTKYLRRHPKRRYIPHAKKFSDAMNKTSSDSLPTIDLEDVALLQYTGGTTGVPKGAVLTHGNIVANLQQISAWISPFLKMDKEVIITALPMYHIFSLTANCLTFMKMGALNVLITDPRNMRSFVKTLSKVPFTAITGVNTLFNGLLSQSSFRELDFSHLRLALGGGMPVQRAVAEKWQQVTGSPLLEAYGLTETSPAVTINPLNLSAYNGSIGLPIPSTEISLRNEQGDELSIGEVGELWIKGPQVMREYWKQPEETAQVFTEPDWLRTGDCAEMDAQGFLYMRERLKDMILVSGFNVYPSEVEDAIMTLEGVAEVAVVGVPHETAGEMVKAFVVKKDPQLTQQDVMHYCREELTAYKVPRKIEFRDSLPKSSVGKILRKELFEKE